MQLEIWPSQAQKPPPSSTAEFPLTVQLIIAPSQCQKPPAKLPLAKLPLIMQFLIGPLQP
jgi:hypothetical protein